MIIKGIFVAIYYLLITISLVTFGWGVLNIADTLTDKLIEVYKNNKNN